MRLSAILLSFLSISGFASTAAAQGQLPANTVRTPVTIVLVEALPAADASFLVQRRTDVEPHDVIVLRTGATTGELSNAVRSLLTARQVGGELPTRTAAFRMRPQQKFQASRPDFPWAARVLHDLGRAELRDVPGLGRVQAIQIWLPRQHR